MTIKILILIQKNIFDAFIQNSFIASHQTYYDIQHRHISINYKYQYKYSNKLSWEQRELEILWDLWAPCLFHI